MTTSRIPSPLSSYLRLPPEASLALVTSTVNTTANWVLLRYIYAALNQQENGRNAIASLRADNTGVVLVSYLRDSTFWKTEARRAVGLDLARLQQQGRFAFVDGLSGLFTEGERNGGTSAVGSTGSPMRASPRTPVPAIPGRSPLPTRGPSQPLPQLTASSTTPHPSTNTPGQHTLTSPTLTHVLATITSAVTSMTTKHNLVILDTPSLLLATTSPPISSQHLSSFLLTLSAHPAVHSLVLSLPADEPFLAPAASAALAHLHDHSPGKSMSGGGGYESLEKENASFVVSATHMARTVMSCRPLGTGWAEDVSGVVRVTRGGAADDEEGDGDGAADREVDAVKEGEWLYFVGGDGAVDVWGRGEGAS